MEWDEIIEMIEVARLQRFKKLSLSNRGITSLPPDIGKLNFLQSLDLSYNSIRTLPVEFLKLINLKSLYINHNELVELPKDIGTLKSLSIFDLSNNQLKTLPASIGSLINLTQLDVSYNQIIRLPIELINLTGLKKLYLENNPCEFPPEKVIKRGLYATMHYLFGELRKRESAKVMIQVYNMPRDITQPFTQYLQYFNDLVASYQHLDINFDVKFIKQDFNTDMELDLEMESYLLDFLSFIKTNIDSIPSKEDSKDISKVFDVQVVELRSHLNDLQKLLEDKVLDIKELQTRIGKLSEIIEQKK
jgi:Leucine-rich repeat (LRR) protein